MQKISITEYDTAERVARCVVSNAQIISFQPTTFHHIGYPTRIENERELEGYVDLLSINPHMSCVFAKGEFTRGASLLASYSPDEADIINAMLSRVAALTYSICGKSIKPLINGLNQMGVFRAVIEYARLCGDRPLRILEIGPGFGYLGAYLAGQGHVYCSMDVTQSLYIWQNRLMDWLYGCELRELAGAPLGTEFPVERIVHLPWWHYCTLFQRTLPVFDVILANGVLGEMTPGALLYSLRLWRKMMEDSPHPAIIFNNFGNPIQTSVAGVIDQFSLHGFSEVLKEKIYLFSPFPERLSKNVRKMEKEIPLYRPSSRLGEMGAAEFLKVDRHEMPNAVAFNEFTFGWSIPDLR